jgi:hypothetical protein
MVLPHHLEDRTGPATTTTLQRCTTLQSVTGTPRLGPPFTAIPEGRRPVPCLVSEGDAALSLTDNFYSETVNLDPSPPPYYGATWGRGAFLF